MSKIIKLGMIFDESTAPDFGSIAEISGSELTVLSTDIARLNSILTKSVCGPLALNGFSIRNGTVCFVPNWKTAQTAKAYMYESSSDQWYEMIENDT